MFAWRFLIYISIILEIVESTHLFDTFGIISKFKDVLLTLLKACKVSFFKGNNKCLMRIKEIGKWSKYTISFE